MPCQESKPCPCSCIALFDVIVLCRLVVRVHC
jgi:hypothetical protein